MKITTTAFAEGQAIPARHTVDGEDLSPAFVFADVPAQAKALALICDDPDAPAGVWDHWVLFNIPAGSAGLAEGVPRENILPDASAQGLNSWRKVGYNGPCPPRGTRHRYFFRLYALDAKLNIKAGVTKAALLRAMEGHVLAEARLMGTYAR